MLIGREKERAFLNGWVAGDKPLLSVCGEPGIGKSEIVGALRLEHPELRWIQADRVSHIEELAARMLEAIDGEDDRLTGETLEQCASRYPGLLFVIDDADELGEELCAWLEHLHEASPVDGRWRMIVTSRRPLTSGERLPIGPLDVEDAAALLARGIEVEPQDGNLLRLARLLDGNPLALTLAAKRLRMMEPSELAARLRARKRTLGGGLGRFASLEEAISLSLGALSERERETLARLSVFAGAFTIDAAEAILPDESRQSASALSRESVLDLLQGLFEHALIRRLDINPVRFLLPRTLRAHVRSIGMDEDTERRLQERHAAFFGERAGRILDRSEDSPKKDVQELLHFELDDILAARENSEEPFRPFLSWLLSRRGMTTTWGVVTLDASAPLERALALQRSARELVASSQEGVARVALAQAISLFGSDLADPALESELRIALLKLAMRAGDLRSAALESEHLWLLERARGEERSAVKVAWRGARLWLQLGDEERALDALERIERALREDATLSVPKISNAARLLRARLLRERDPGASEESATRVLLDLKTSPGADPKLLARTHTLLGDLAAATRDFESAEQCYQRARAAYDEHGVVERLYDALRALGEHERALALLASSLKEQPSAALRARSALESFTRGEIEEARESCAALLEERASMDQEVAHAILVLSELCEAFLGRPNDVHTLCDALAARSTKPLARCLRAAVAILDQTSIEDPPDRWTASEHVSDFFADTLESIAGTVDVTRARAVATYQMRAVKKATEDSALVLEPGCTGFVLPGGEQVSLGRKKLLIRLLTALVERRIDTPGEAVSWQELFEIGWPGEEHTHEDAALNRLRVAIRRLRAMGLEELLLTQDESGYLLDSEHPITILELLP